MSAVINAVEMSLSTLSQESPICVGLSGGLDSVVLLHSLSSLRINSPLRAIHVNHNLHSRSADWQSCCESLCARLGTELRCVSVDVKESLKGSESGVELAARELRYDAFSAELMNGEVLLLAHHLDDQMETLLLRMMRGSGVAGMTGIPQVRPLKDNSVLRPFLKLTREELEQYAHRNDLDWIEDPSNQDTSYDRNFCRHSVLPLLEGRWPGYRESWSKSQQLFKEAGEILAERASEDLLSCAGELPKSLDLELLQSLSAGRKRNLLKLWLEREAEIELGWGVLQSTLAKLEGSLGSSAVLIELKTHMLVVHRSNLVLTKRLAEPELPTQEWDINRSSVFNLPGNGELKISHQSEHDFEKAFTVRYREEGDLCKLRKRPSKSLKKLFQEHSVPVWLRNRIPLICYDEKIVFIPTLGITEDFPNLEQWERASLKFSWHFQEVNWSFASKSD